MDFSKLKVVEDKNRSKINEPPFYKEVIFKGEELVNLEYEPVFDYFTEKTGKKVANSHRVLDGEFVTIEDGSGIVHIAPGFGEDDFNLCKKNNIGVVCPVDDGGCFCLDEKDDNVEYDLSDKHEILKLNGRQVFETNDDVIKYLKSKDLWIKTEQYLHNYPHCWRTDTPLIYKAVSSWYVKVTDFKDRMCELNKQINWIPENVKDGQFGKWLENARDWSITRNRFWGAPVPVWRCSWSLCIFSDHIEISESNIEKNIVTQNRFYFSFDENIDELLGDNFIRCVTDSNISCKFCIQCDGKEYKKTTYQEFKELLIILSKEKRNYVCCFLSLEIIPSCIEDMQKLFFYSYIYDYVHGKNSGRFILNNNNIPEDKYKEMIKSFFETKKQDERTEIAEKIGLKKSISEIFVINDLHRPYIDELKFNFNNFRFTYLKRVPDVLDCWFESGSMPYAQVHYPFEYRDGNGNLIRTKEENEKWFNTHFPCDFVTEYVAQTRGWFYTMMVLATALFDKIPFKNVICHGVMLDINGQKLSKRLRNYPDPLEMIDVYGSDAMRWLMASSPVVQGGDMRIDKDGKMIADIVKNILNPIWNSFMFYKQYAELDKIKIESKIDSQNVMDVYILSKLKLFIEKFTNAMDKYNTIDACHEVELFIETLNNWYIRRNKERFWKSEHDKNKQQAYETLHLVLKTFSIYVSPLLPFLCEKIYQDLVHFESC